MARAFKPQEKNVIRAALLAEGRKLFARHGLKRTTVQDLTRAAGISQGAFYGFFPSKEDLFIEILEEEEAAFFGTVEAEIQSCDLDRQKLKGILLQAFERYRAHAFLGSLFGHGEYDQLMRGVPEQRLHRHVEGEVPRVAQLVETLHAQGRVRAMEPKLAVSVLQAIFLLFLQEGEFAPGTFAPMINLIVGLLADYIATAGERNYPD